MADETGKLSPVREVWIVERQERWSKEIDDEDEPVRYDHDTMVVDIFDSKDKAIEGLLDNVKKTMESRKYGNDILQPPTLEQVKEAYEILVKPNCSLYSKPIYAYSRAEYGDYIRYRIYKKEVK